MPRQLPSSPPGRAGELEAAGVGSAARAAGEKGPHDTRGRNPVAARAAPKASTDNGRLSPSVRSPNPANAGVRRPNPAQASRPSRPARMLVASAPEGEAGREPIRGAKRKPCRNKVAEGLVGPRLRGIVSERRSSKAVVRKVRATRAPDVRLVWLRDVRAGARARARDVHTQKIRHALALRYRPHMG